MFYEFRQRESFQAASHARDMDYYNRWSRTSVSLSSVTLFRCANTAERIEVLLEVDLDSMRPSPNYFDCFLLCVTVRTSAVYTRDQRPSLLWPFDLQDVPVCWAPVARVGLGLYGWWDAVYRATEGPGSTTCPGCWGYITRWWRCSDVRRQRSQKGMPPRYLGVRLSFKFLPAHQLCCEQVLLLAASVCLWVCLHKISKTTYQKLM